MSRNNIIGWLKRGIITIFSPIRKNPYKIDACNICVRFILWIQPIINYVKVMIRFPILTGKLYFPID